MSEGEGGKRVRRVGGGRERGEPVATVARSREVDISHVPLT